MSPATLPTRKIGAVDVTAIGYGAMGIAAIYGDKLTEDERFKVRSSDLLCQGCALTITRSVQVLDTLYELGCTNWDTADIYADSEDLIGAWYVSRRFAHNIRHTC